MMVEEMSDKLEDSVRRHSLATRSDAGANLRSVTIYPESHENVKHSPKHD